MQRVKDLGMSKESLCKPLGQSRQHGQRRGDKGMMAGMNVKTAVMGLQFGRSSSHSCEIHGIANTCG